MSQPTNAAAPTSEPTEPARGHALIRCWGTRGSIPSPGPSTAGFGGNTTCIEVRIGSRRLVFDAGSGIRLLGNELSLTEEPVSADIFLTHFHWDHIQGFPFFGPLYDPRTSLSIHGPTQQGIDVEKLFAGQMGPIYFPVPFEAVAATCAFNHVTEESWDKDGIRISAMRMRHPSFTVGYSLEWGGSKLCILPDNELGQGDYPVAANWHDQLLEFIQGADVLFHDAMYTEEEYPTKIGWGHSTFRQTVDLADAAGVKRLFFFHHDPARGDHELSGIVSRFQLEAEEKGLNLRIEGAREGRNIMIEEP